MDDQLVVNQLKGLIIDAVNLAQSGHPGGPLSSVDFAYVLFSEFLKYDPDSPDWLGRDRFVLSAGHASMLQYALLYAQGFLNISDLRNFRQFSSRTPGHPENHITPGVECTTGPLGQGCAMSVGFAIGAAHLSARLDARLFDTRTWVILGDGCMQEGITLSAASLAGHLQLSNLVWFYDKNRIQISGSTDRVYSDNEEEVFRGFGWNVITIDGHDRKAIREAIACVKQESSRPSLIVGKTTIANGAATLAGSAKTHGAPLPAEEYSATRGILGLGDKESFYFSPEARAHFRRHQPSLRTEVSAWNRRLQAKLDSDASFAHLWQAMFAASRSLDLPSYPWKKEQEALATRQAFGLLLEYWADAVPNLLGGSADLEPSNMTAAFANRVKDFSSSCPEGRNIAFGVREFPMAAICNGLALYGGLIPFGATFLVFSDYMRNAVRLGALQRLQVIHEFTHDSFYLGEDGPTHQPIEHIMSLRAIPELYVTRPADANETEALLGWALATDKSSCHCLSRQKLAQLPIPRSQIMDGAVRGGWLVYGSLQEECDVIFFATGSEVQLALTVAKQLAQRTKLTVRVISLPCWELFFSQPQDYQDSILARSCSKRISVEAGTSLGWERFIGLDGLSIAIDHFGASAKAIDLEAAFGFSSTAVLEEVSSYLAK